MSASLREWLVARLPDYMVPAAFVVLDALPLTPNGKLDRQALPAPEGADVARAYVAPTTPEEVLLCDLVAALVGVARVGLADDFFQLGGHSLLATRLVAQIRMRLGRELPLRTIFETPGLGALAQALRTLPPAGPPLAPQARPAALPLSFAQARLWFLHQLEGAQPTYHIPVAVQLEGALDAAALAHALADVVARHDSLRTLLVPTDAGPVQHVLPIVAVPGPLPTVATTPATLTADLAAAAAHGFDLATEPPLRATLFRLAADTHVLLLLLHHSAADGWSIAPLLEDLATAYTARRAGTAPAFVPLPVQYADYTLWQRARLGREDDPASPLARQIAYWTTQLAALPAELALPTDRPRPRTPTYGGGVVDFTLPAALTAQLQALARAEGATLFMLLQAALAALLTKLGAGPDIPIGAPIAGRTEAALDRLVGFFVNTLVLRTDTRGNPSFTALLARARATCLAAYAHQDLPFERLVELLDPPRAFGRQPLFQTMLVVQHTPPPTLALPGVRARDVVPPTRTTKFDLTLTLTVPPAADGAADLVGALDYSTDLFDPASAAQLVARFTHLLAQIAADPTVPLHRLAIVDADERTRVLDTFNATDAPVPAATLVALLEQQVARTPAAPALRTATATLTYAALDARANQLAWHLLAAGVGPEARVALALPRAADLIVALLATLKAGAAFVPLDPDAPRPRLAALLADAAPRALLTTTALAPALAPAAPLVLALDAPAVQAALAAAPATAPTDADRPTPLHPLHPAYVLYTSGSTGTPKGVVVDSLRHSEPGDSAKPPSLGNRDEPRAPTGVVLLRRGPVGAGNGAVVRSHPGTGGLRRTKRRRARSFARHGTDHSRHLHAHRSPNAERRMRSQSAGDDRCRRTVHSGPRRHLGKPVSGVQRVWSDRSHRLRDDEQCADGPKRSTDRRTDREHPRLCPRRRAAAVSDRRGWRALPRRRRPGAWLLGPPQSDRRALRRTSVGGWTR